MRIFLISILIVTAGCSSLARQDIPRLHKQLGLWEKYTPEQKERYSSMSRSEQNELLYTMHYKSSMGLTKKEWNRLKPDRKAQYIYADRIYQTYATELWKLRVSKLSLLEMSVKRQQNLEIKAIKLRNTRVSNDRRRMAKAKRTVAAKTPIRKALTTADSFELKKAMNEAKKNKIYPSQRITCRRTNVPGEKITFECIPF